MSWKAKGMAQMTEHRPANCICHVCGERPPAVTPADGSVHCGHSLDPTFSPGSTAELIAGVVRLVEGQRRLGQELGLKDERVFPSAAADFQERDPASVLRRWMRDPDGPASLRALFDDLFAHQLALVRAVDGVAVSAMQKRRSLGPLSSLQNLNERLFGAGSLRLLMEDERARFRHVVAPAFATNYTRAREKELEERLDMNSTHTS